MMTFYLSPPEGIVPVHLFQLYAESRLNFLITFTKCPNKSLEELIREKALEIPRLDSIMEGSTKDRVSHFALRSMSIIDPDLFHFVQFSETQLFQRRLQNYLSGKEFDTRIRQLICQLRHFLPFLSQLIISIDSKKHALQLDQHRNFLEVATKVLLRIVKQRLTFCIDITLIDGKCPTHLNFKVLSLPFTQVLKMVTKMSVILVGGDAQLLCHQIPVYYEIVFTKLLEVSTEIMKSTDCWNRIQSDTRLQEGCTNLRRIFTSHGYIFPIHGNSISEIGPSAHFIDYESLHAVVQTFPPCMSNIYHSLRRHHRLCHHPRVQLTLFLKAIGVSVEVMLRLLQEEYSKSQVSNGEAEESLSMTRSHKCEHSWQTDSRRYIYGTRHLFGLEGSRKNYSSHTCSAIQSTVSFSGCGGCPFVLHDRKQFKILSDDLADESSAREFMDRIREKTDDGGGAETLGPIETCHEYLWYKVSLNKSFQGRGTEACQNEAIQNSFSKRTCTDRITKGDNEAKNIVLISKPTHFYRAIKSLL